MPIMREAVAVFDDLSSLESAVYELETNGFDRASFSVLANEAAVEKKLGHRYRQVKEMEDNPAAPRETFFSHVSRLEADYLSTPILAAIGALALAGAGPLAVIVATGAGAALGAALSVSLHEHHARNVAEQLARGGLLLWVDLRNARDEETARRILAIHSAHDVHVHDIRLA
jgi:hypothetical protein